MPVDTRNFSIAADTKNGVLNEQRLAADLAANATITTAVDGVANKGDGTFDVRFADTLSAGEVTELTGDASPPAAGSVIGEHTGLSVVMTAEFSEEEYTGGRLTKVTHYAEKVGEGVYAYPVEERTYTYAGNKLMSETVKEFAEDGTVVSDKTYNFSTVSGKVRKELA